MKYTAASVIVLLLVVWGGVIEALEVPHGRTLKMGDKGKDVKALQELLYKNGLYSGPITGYFGEQTRSAIELFQSRSGLEVVGYVGPKTCGLLSLLQYPFSIGRNSIVMDLPEAIDVPKQATSSVVTSAAPNIEYIQHSTSLPYSASEFSKWIGTWGKVSTSSQMLILNATASTTGAGAILPGSLTWGDYRYTANVSIYQGTVTLYGRYVDEENFAACSFSGNYVRAIQKVSGVTTILGKTSVHGMSRGPFFHTNTNIGMRVDGEKIGCILLGPDDNVVGDLDGSLLRGGIGIESWHEVPGVAGMTLHGVDVRPL